MKPLELKALSDISTSLGVNVDDLYSLINFESKWNYNVKNPRSSARGLLQFTDSTAKSLGYKDSLDLVTQNNSVESQLYFPVLQYLSQYKPFPTKQSLYMSVFYPAARKWPVNKEFPISVQNANPGIKTVKDYLDKVDNKKKKFITIGSILLIIELILLFGKVKK